MRKIWNFYIKSSDTESCYLFTQKTGSHLISTCRKQEEKAKRITALSRVE